jgi:hypothetical protein
MAKHPRLSREAPDPGIASPAARKRHLRSGSDFGMLSLKSF